MQNKQTEEVGSNDELPESHREYLAERQEAFVDDEDYFVTLDELEADLRVALSLTVN